ncbi:MAG TPA: aminomethyl transferase family protein [Pseudolysinimonas sp.]|nr:aminomethyl transferase family protein [Pseudolysinimonas sp.]
MTEKSLADLLREYSSPVQALRNVPSPTTGYPGLAPQFSNWRSEQRAWREAAALLDQSFHMANLFVDGPDAVKVFSDLAINRFDNFAPGIAKQFIAADAEGRLLGDGILVYLGENSLDLVSEQNMAHWVAFHIETGNYDVTYELEYNAQRRQGPPRYYRYEVQGPTALAAIEAATGAPAPSTKFFHLTEFTIAGKQVRAIRHGMAGQPGFEFFGPWEDAAVVREALLTAGKPHGLIPVGTTAYFTNNIESGWLANPIPAFYSGESTAAFREWLPAWAAAGLGGSYDPDDIEDYFITPFDAGYGKFIAQDHDFVGRAALESLANKPSREKVTLIWNEDDLGKAFHDLADPDSGLPPQYMDPARMKYSLYQYDKVTGEDGNAAGFTTHTAYLSFDRRFASLALIDQAYAKPGTRVTITWGDSLRTPRPDVEAHRQIEVRATVAPVPFSDFARESYRKA